VCRRQKASVPNENIPPLGRIYVIAWAEFGEVQNISLHERAMPNLRRIQGRHGGRSLLPSCPFPRRMLVCLYRNSFITTPLQVTNRSFLPSHPNIHRVRDVAKPRKRRCPRRNRPFKSHRLSPHPPRQRLPSNDPIKTAPARQPSNPQLYARGSPDRVLTFSILERGGCGLYRFWIDYATFPTIICLKNVVPYDITPWDERDKNDDYEN
jgi:hypothetical protein